MMTAQIDKWYCITDDKKVYGPWNSHHDAVMGTNHIPGIRTIANGENVPPNAKVLLCPGLTYKQIEGIQAAWELDGFKFIGNGFENNEEDPYRCPMCDKTYIFWALWEHPTRTRYGTGGNPQGGEYNPHLLNEVNHCYDCGYIWIDVDEERR